MPGTMKKGKRKDGYGSRAGTREGIPGTVQKRKSKAAMEVAQALAGGGGRAIQRAEA